MKKPLILITNDDGIFAGGIRELVSIAQEIGEVVIVAPDAPQSAMGHAITIREPLRLKKATEFPNLEAYKCSGTPADCIKLASNVVLKDRKIDLCVSGINHGSNASINILYSGTMAGAMEASMEGIPSIGFSLLDFSPDADFSQAREQIKAIMLQVIEKGIPNGHLLNVNIPKLAKKDIKGVKVCRQAKARWKETFIEKTDPIGRPYYWLSGEFQNLDDGDDTDIAALNAGYISVVPSKHDLTNYDSFAGLKSLEDIS